jgi:hypothetical protein
MSNSETIQETRFLQHIRNQVPKAEVGCFPETYHECERLLN